MSLATDAGGGLVFEQRFLPYGEPRWQEGALPTDFGFGGQREDGSTGLVFMHARYYHAGLARWTQADTIVPDFANPQSLNRLSYVRNNPLKYIDPSGYCIPGLDCPDEGVPPTSPYGISFTADEEQSWHRLDKAAVIGGAHITSLATARALIQRNRELMKAGDLGSVEYVPDPEMLFREVFGDLGLHQSAASCEQAREDSCWAFTWVPGITYYTNAPHGGLTSQNVVHELGHAFAQRAGRQPYTDLAAEWGVDSNFPRRDPANLELRGYAGPRFGWQQSHGTSENEESADMYLGWAYNRWETDLEGRLALAGRIRSQWMTANMADWIVLTLGQQ